jgi:hypothetical protein
MTSSFYEFSRAKVERLDYSHFLSRFAPEKLPTGRAGPAFLGCMMLGFAGPTPWFLNCFALIGGLGKPVSSRRWHIYL